MDKEIGIAKIVASATPNSWSQAYNAGKLFAVISLETEAEMEENALNLLGKEILDNLEAEYFTLENKDLEGIKKAVESSLEKVLENIKCSFIVGSINKNVLYVFAKNGKVEIKRGEKLGNVLNSGNDLTGASGFLDDKDIIILETSQFSNLLPQDLLLSSIDGHPINEIAENIAPMIHEKNEGGATAILVEYKQEQIEEIPQTEGIIAQTPVPQDEYIQTPQEEHKPQSLAFLSSYLNFAKEKIQKVKVKGTFDKSRRSVLTIAVILLVILLGSTVLALKKQSETKTTALLAQYYTPAQKKFEEGQSLLDLNQNLARDSFSSAQKILLEGEPKFDKGSSGKKQMDDLLNKVNSALSQSANVKTVNPQEVDSSQSKTLGNELKNSGIYATFEGNDVYLLDSNGVSKNSKLIIKKAWTTPGGLGVYFGNIYVLDKSSKQILKFVNTGSDYVKTNYLASGTSPDVSKAQGIAIDGSIWVLLGDGTLLKFTRGNADNLSLTGLDKAFSSPTRIFTNADTDNVYILDNGNSRIIVFDKTGAYKVQYQSALLKTAKDLDVNEKDGKLFFLQGSKIYSISL